MPTIKQISFIANFVKYHVVQKQTGKILNYNFFLFFEEGIGGLSGGVFWEAYLTIPFRNDDNVILNGTLFL